MTSPRSASSTASAPSVAKSGRRSAASRRSTTGLGVAPDRLEDRRPLRVQRGPVRAASPRGVEVGERLGEAVEGGPRPGPGQPGRAVVRRVAHQLLGQLRGALVVGDPAQHLPAQQEQVDQEGRVRPPSDGRRLPARIVPLRSRAARPSIWACRFATAMTPLVVAGSVVVLGQAR